MRTRHLFLAGSITALLLLSACESQLKGGPTANATPQDVLTADLGQSGDRSRATDQGTIPDSRPDSAARDAAPPREAAPAPDQTAPADRGPTPDRQAPPPDLAPTPDSPRPDLFAGDQGPLANSASVVYLHHSTGGRIWNGGVPAWLQAYNLAQGTSYAITEQAFPKESPYGWENYPYDYWNIWVNHAGSQPYLTEPTLELLTQQFDVIVFKHCFPVSAIQADSGTADVTSAAKRQENYRLQYEALKQKMRAFPQTRFLVWTGAALTAGASSANQGTRAREFFSWVKESWDEPGDNIFVWDFFELETEGGIFLLDAYADSSSDSHPNDTFSSTVAPLFGQRLVDVIEGRGDSGSLTGQ